MFRCVQNNLCVLFYNLCERLQEILLMVSQLGEQKSTEHDTNQTQSPFLKGWFLITLIRAPHIIDNHLLCLQLYELNESHCLLRGHYFFSQRKMCYIYCTIQVQKMSSEAHTHTHYTTTRVRINNAKSSSHLSFFFSFRVHFRAVKYLSQTSSTTL